MFWVNAIAFILGVGLLIFLLVKPRQKAPDLTPTESIATEYAATGQTPAENQDNTTKPIAPQTDCPKFDEIEYYFVNGTYDGQPAVLLGYKNNSKYTVTSVQLYFKMKADATPEELALFDTFVNSGALTPKKLAALSPYFVSEIVCDPGETKVGAPCTLFYQTYATDAKQCQALTLNGAAITYLSNDGNIRTVAYSAKNNTHKLEATTRTAKKWSPAYFAKTTPMPNTRFITVNRSDYDCFQFTAYDMTQVQYNAYCSECYSAGFTNNVAVDDSAFNGTTAFGLTLNIEYHPEKQAMVVVATMSTGNTNKDPEQIQQAAEKYIAGFAPVLSDQVVQYVQADSSKSVIYERTGGSIVPVPVWLPKLQPFSDDAIACQADIEKDLEEVLNEIEADVNGGYETDLHYITFDAVVNRDILSILIKSQYRAGGYMVYYTYNFDITTSKRLDNEALIEKLQITDFDQRLTQTAKNGFETKYGPVDNNDSFKTQQLNATIDPENLKKTQFYVGQDGKMMTVLYVHAIAGAAGYYELVPFS